MMVVEPAVETPEDIQALPLDPFGLAPGLKSRISGVGGEEPSADPAYAAYGFHTPYARLDDGLVQFTVRFVGLEATRGALTLSVNGQSDRPGSSAYRVAVDHIPLRNIVIDGGVATIRIEASAGSTYALLGFIYDDTDAMAEGLAIDVRCVLDIEALTEKRVSSRRTAFGASGMRPVARLISNDRATLADPVSQMCTASQFDEAVYGEWTDRLREGTRHDRRQWASVYILQSLRRYGMLEAGARGLGFGVGGGPLPAVMAAMGCSIVATERPMDEAADPGDGDGTRPGAPIEALRRPDICSDGEFDARVSFRPIDWTALPPGLVDFDFAWSAGASTRLGSIAAGLRFIEQSVQCLKPGGMAVHTTEMNLGPHDHVNDDGATVLFRRKDFDQLALTLISRGHEVAQLKYDRGEIVIAAHDDVPPSFDRGDRAIPATSFGIIVRRGLDT